MAVVSWFASLFGSPAPCRSEVDPADATWHISINELWGRDNRGPRNLDIYPVFEDGRWVRALATARRFNTSVHLVRKTNIQFRENRFAGDLNIIITNDPWIPEDGRPISLKLRVEGELVLGEDGQSRFVRGSYQGTLGEQPVRGSLGGGVGATETGWENSQWSFNLNPVSGDAFEHPPILTVTLGIADGRVNWGRAGITRRHNQSAPRTIFFDTAGLSVDGAEVRGSFTLPNRVIDSAGDPALERRVTFTGHRVQGLLGGEARVQAYRDGEPVGPARDYYGRGVGTRGGGVEADRDVLWRHDLDNRPWYVPTADYVPPAAGEHPRLLFRRAELPELRRRAQTEEGRKIVDRLRFQLNGGDGRSLPAGRNPFRGMPPQDNARSAVSNAPVGEAFTLFHAAGYGMLWQLTGEEIYARLGRQSVEMMLDGQRDRDNRYSFRDPRNTLRAGVALSAMALAYDLLYDSWDAEFRKQVTEALEKYDEGGNATLEWLVHGGTYMPGSNHWGVMTGGAAKALLAIRGNPEVGNHEEIDRLLAISARMMVHNLDHAFGDLGFFPEGDGTGVMASLINYLAALQAWKVAGGKDFFNAPRENVRRLVMRWVLLTVARDGRPEFPNLGGYPHNIWARGMSGPGVFSWGFAAVPEADRPALLWLYNRVEPHVGPYETNNPYPFRAIGSLINWPLGLAEQNPEHALPRAAVDTLHGHLVHRKQWQDGDDILVTAFLQTGHAGYIGINDRNAIRVWGMGLRTDWRAGLAGTLPVHYESSEDGSGNITVRRGDDLSALGIDFSEAAGVPLLMVGYGPALPANRFRNAGRDNGPNVRAQTVQAGDHRYVIITMQQGAGPNITAEGQGPEAYVRIGNQTVRFDGRRLVFRPVE